MKPSEENKPMLPKTPSPSQVDPVASSRQQKSGVPGPAIAAVNMPVQLLGPDLVSSLSHLQSNCTPSTNANVDDLPSLKDRENYFVSAWNDPSTKPSKSFAIEPPKRFGVMKIALRPRPSAKQNENSPQLGNYIPGSVFLSMMNV